MTTRKTELLAIGLARYDSDRGGAQEDDRTGGYQNCADEILNYAKKHKLRTKVIFINDGPGFCWVQCGTTTPIWSAVVRVKFWWQFYV